MRIKGFTYLEVLIVISIIAILATVSSYVYTGAKANSRDARRKSDLAQLQLALASYKADNNSYPPSSLTALTFGKYIESIPADPSKTTYSYIGLSDEVGLSSSCTNDCQTYRLMARLEGTATICGNGYGNCNGSTNSCTYCLSPDGVVPGQVQDSDGDGIPDSSDPFPNDWSPDACASTPTIVGTNGNNTIMGTSGDDIIHALGGIDTITGNGGNDQICTLDGSDTITTSSGNDAINAAGGSNTITAGSGSNYIITGSGIQTITSTAGRDIIQVQGGSATVTAGDGNNYVETGAGSDTITTGTGIDTILAGAGNNTVLSSSGDDNITAGSGNDTINAGSGTDTCAADGGSNTLVGCEL